MNFNLPCKLLVICAFVFGLQPSCSVEKRLYRPGYHIEWKKKKSFEAVQKSTKTEELQTESSIVESKLEVTEFVSKDSSFADFPLLNSTVSSENTISTIEPDEVKRVSNFQSVEPISQPTIEKKQFKKANPQHTRIEADWLGALYLILVGLALLGLGFLFVYFLSEVFVLGILLFFLFLTAAALCVLFGIFLMLYLLLLA